MAPFKLPVRFSTSTLAAAASSTATQYLVTADHELIASVTDATAEERQFIVDAINATAGPAVNFALECAAKELEAQPRGKDEPLDGDQRAALMQLSQAMKLATTAGLFDALQIDCDSPDSINDVCDAVAYRMRVC